MTVKSSEDAVDNKIHEIINKVDNKDDIIELKADSDDEYVTDEESDEVESNASYGNFKILDKEGKKIGLCDYKRYKWYLRQNLATKVDEKTLMINFEPNFKSGKIMKLVERATICVVCGSKKKLRKFHVVPLQFKRHYPIEKKEHNSSDVVLLCKDCSINANHITDKFKKVIYDKLNVSNKDFTDQTKVDIRKFAGKIEKNRNYKRSVQEEMDQLKKLLNRTDNLSNEEVKEYSKLDSSTSYKGYSTIGELVTCYFKDAGKIDYFSQKWKENFQTNLEPKHLPGDFFENYGQEVESR